MALNWFEVEEPESEMVHCPVDGLGHTLLSVTAHYIIQHLITLHIAEVGINIRHADAFRI